MLRTFAPIGPYRSEAMLNCSAGGTIPLTNYLDSNAVPEGTPPTDSLRLLELDAQAL